MCARKRPLRVVTSDVSWFDHEERYSGGKWYSKWRRGKYADEIAALAAPAYDARNIQFAQIKTINPVEKSRRPRPIPFRHRGALKMYHFLRPETAKIITIDAGGEQYGLESDGTLYLRRRMHSPESIGKAELWIPLPKKLEKSNLTNPMLLALLEVFRTLVPQVK